VIGIRLCLRMGKLLEMGGLAKLEAIFSVKGWELELDCDCGNCGHWCAISRSRRYYVGNRGRRCFSSASAFEYKSQTFWLGEGGELRLLEWNDRTIS